MRLVKKLTTLGIVSALCISFSTMVSAADTTKCTTKYNGVTTTVTAKTVSDKDNDCTYFRITNSKAKKKTQNLIIDMGATKDTDEEKRPYYKAFSKAFLDELKNDNYVIDHLVITHGHEDHIYGIKYLKDKLKENHKKQEGVQKITINNLYINGLNMEQGKMYWLKIQNLLETNYFDVKHVYCFGVLGLGDSQYVTDDTLNLCSRFKNFTEAKNYLCQPKWVEITGTGVVFKVIPPMYYHTESGSQGANNNSLIVTIQDEKSQDEKSKLKLKEFKYIMPGDIEGAAIYDIMTKTKKVDRKGPDGKVQKDVTYNYQNYIEKKVNSFDGGYKKVILKSPHHGKARLHSYVRTKNDDDKSYYSFAFPEVAKGFSTIFDSSNGTKFDKLASQINNSVNISKDKKDKTTFMYIAYWFIKSRRVDKKNHNLLYENNTEYVATKLGNYENKFIECIQPDIIVGTKWNPDGLPAGNNKALDDGWNISPYSVNANNIAIFEKYLDYCVKFTDNWKKPALFKTFASQVTHDTSNSAIYNLFKKIEEFRAKSLSEN